MLALCHAREAGHQVVALATFAPCPHCPRPSPVASTSAGGPRSAASAGYTIEAPFDLCYERALAKLKEEWQLDGVVTSDIDSVGGSPNWIRERYRPFGIKIHTPLWQLSREAPLAIGHYQVAYQEQLAYLLEDEG